MSLATDTTPPVTTVTAHGNGGSLAVSVYLSASDAGSGMAGGQAAINYSQTPA